MPSVTFNELMQAAERGGYAVGYFESWNLESLLAVADAAEAQRSPVILGVSGIYLPSPNRIVCEKLGVYLAAAREIADTLSVPACILFNESPYRDWVEEAIMLGFDLVMFTDESLPVERQTEIVAGVVKRAHVSGIAVEGEMASLPGVIGGLEAVPEDLHLTDPAQACAFVDRTEVDAFAVNIGQAHLHGRKHVALRLDLLDALHKLLPVPLVLHAASSVAPEDLRAAIAHGIRKINVGSVLKQRYFSALRDACLAVPPGANPYEIIGSGTAQDVEAIARRALQEVVEEWMQLFGSAGKAP